MIKRTDSIQSFLAGDLTRIKELFHPKNDGIQLSFSLALATLEKGESSLPHRLEKSCEVYYILYGTGIMHIDDVVSDVRSGDTVYIEPNALQYIENKTAGPLAFLCIVSPPWSPEDEVIL